MVKNHSHGSIGHNKHGNHTASSSRASEEPLPAVKKARLHANSISLTDDESLAVLLGAVNSTTTVRDVRSGARFSLAVEQDEEVLSVVHHTIAQLLVEPLISLTSLDLTGNILAPDPFAALAEALSSPACRRLLVLDMKWVGLGPEGCRVLAGALRANNSLTRLNLERNGLGWSGGRALGAALAVNTSLTSVDLSLNDIGPEGGTAVATALTSNTCLTELMMVRCGVGPDGAKALGAALEQNSSLTTLDVTQNDLGVKGGIALGRALEVNNALTRLNLSNNRIGFGLERAGGFARSLVVNTSLTWLDMSQNELGALGGEAFAAALRVNTTLEELQLQRNGLGKVGGVALGRSVGVNSGLTTLDVSQNDMGDEGAAAFGDALACSSSLASLNLARNGVGVEGGRALFVGLSGSTALDSLNVTRNDLGPGGGMALANALAANTSLTRLHAAHNGLAESGAALACSVELSNRMTTLDLSSNLFGAAEGTALCAAVSSHRSLVDVDLSSNAITILPVEAQLRLAARRPAMRLDLSNNPLSSPPLGQRADADELNEYLRALQAESTSIRRIRLMVCGYGGVGKTTFCTAAVRPAEELAHFHGSLARVDEWDAPTIASWARRLHTDWSGPAADVFATASVAGKDLAVLVAVGDDGGSVPSATLDRLIGDALSAKQRRHLAIAIGSLMQKGYFSTVGAVKVEGTLPLDAGVDGVEGRECSLVDFAGQMEYLVSHQLLLASMHTLCMVIQPAGSFGSPDHRHHGSWRYWLRFLRALGERRTSSLLLAISQLDRLDGAASADAETAATKEFDELRDAIGGGLGGSPMRLDYRPGAVEDTMAAVRSRLSDAADAVAHDWWVPASYERLAELVQRLSRERKASRLLPILPRKDLHDSLLRADASTGLRAMASDPQLLTRGIEYLEAVGDVLIDARVDCLLLDPVGWFASFLAHFIRDDGNCPAEVVRGVVNEADIIAALRHEYDQPEERVPEIMELVCQLELCIRHSEALPGATAFLFPCLLPPASAVDLAAQWWPATSSTLPPVIRGHRFRASEGFMPPGLFPTLVARLTRLPAGCVHSSRLWSDAAVLTFRTARVLLRLDAAAATLDVVAAAPSDAELFVGAAKGQACVVPWMAHLVRHFLLRGYERIPFDEAWLCPSAQCHVLMRSPCAALEYTGTEFVLETSQASTSRARNTHVCEQEGCWHQLGEGHALEPMRLLDGEGQVCKGCHEEACFTLRAAGRFGWASQKERQQMLRGMSVAQPKMGFGARYSGPQGA